jgi:hypothetical protein
MFLVTLKNNGYIFVYAKNLNEAKEKLLEKVGQQVYNNINWDSLLTGRDAEEIELEYRTIFSR